MKELKKCFGIISGFPEGENRNRRIDRFNQLLEQLNNLWPNVDILVVAQNWKDYKLPTIKNKVELITYKNNIGILEARRVLRKEFLKRDYDYIIMMDDDDIIECDNNHAHLDYMNELDKHPQGFAIIKPKNNKDKTWFPDYQYAQAPLNLCAISRFIYEQEPIPDVNLQKSEALEDDIYVYLLHRKYGQYEFDAPNTIRHIQYKPYQYRFQYEFPDEFLPSTWQNNGINMKRLMENTGWLLRAIQRLGDLPDMEDWHRHDNEKWNIG